MTSSLVGSEMCIRDRRGEGSDRLHPRERVASWVEDEVVGQEDFLAEDAVSYTHLTLPTICSV
eukprot:4220556-Prorocentrum_lima.AAC.1